MDQDFSTLEVLFQADKRRQYEVSDLIKSCIVIAINNQNFVKGEGDKKFIVRFSRRSWKKPEIQPENPVFTVLQGLDPLDGRTSFVCR